MSWVAVAAGVVVGGAQIAIGASQKSKAKKIARKNKRPAFEIPQAVLDNQNLLESRAATGLSDASKQLYSSATDRQLTAAIDAMLRGGSTVGNISELYAANQGNVGRMALIDQEARDANVKAYIEGGNTLAGFQLGKWQTDKWGVYADNAQAAAALSEQGANNINKGVGTIGSAAVNYGMGSMYKGGGNGGGSAVNFGNNGRAAGGSGLKMDSTLISMIPALAGTVAGGNNASSGTGGRSDFGQSSMVPARSASSGSGLAGIDPILIDGVWYDPLTMRPI